jgi:hypothetical protein
MEATSRLTVAIGVATLIITAMLRSGVVAAGPPTAEEAWLPELTRSDALDGPVVIQGRLVDRRGAGVPGHVTLIAWPTQHQLAPLEVGDAVKLVPVAKAIAAADGSFVLRVDPTVPIGEVAAPDGTVNFDLVTDGDQGWSITSFSRRLVEGSEGPTWASTAPEIKPSTGAVLSVRLSIAHDEQRPEALEPAPATDRQCTTFVRDAWDGVLDTVGEVYTGPNTTGDLQYLNGASSTIGVGFSASGDYGSYEAGGTSTVSSTTGVNFPTQGQNRRTVFRTTFGWKLFELSCFAYPYGPWTSAGFEARAVEFQGGTQQYTAASAPTATYCTSYLAGSSFSKDTATAIQFSNGAKIGAFIGIDLSTRTGFNTNTKIRFAFVNAGRLCGTNGYPPQAGRVVAK